MTENNTVKTLTKKRLSTVKMKCAPKSNQHEFRGLLEKLCLRGNLDGQARKKAKAAKMEMGMKGYREEGRGLGGGIYGGGGASRQGRWSGEGGGGGVRVGGGMEGA